MNIETQPRTIDKSDKVVFEFLSDLKNFEQLMPDSRDKFEILDEDTFIFALKGMPEIVLKRKEQTPNSLIVLGAASDKLPFILKADIKALSEEKSEVVLSFQGEFNPMMAMMIKMPITNFVTTLSENLKKI